MLRLGPNVPADRSADLPGRLEGTLGHIGSAVTQPDGKILAVGFFDTLDDAYPGTGYQLARLNPNGTLDLSFGDKGLVAVGPGPNLDGYPLDLTDVKLLAGGKILVAGSTPVGEGEQFDLYLARLNADGSPDASFGSHGAVTVDFGGNEFGTKLATDASGGIYLAATNSSSRPTSRPRSTRRSLRSLPAPASLDPSFDGDGKKTLVNNADFEGPGGGFRRPADRRDRPLTGRRNT